MVYICDSCNEEIAKGSGLLISGENLTTTIVGTSEDPFDTGVFAPLQGKVSITICKECLKNQLDLDR